MNLILKIEKWIYKHFGIILPLWRDYWEWYKKEIQEELDREAMARYFIDSLEN